MLLQPAENSPQTVQNIIRSFFKCQGWQSVFLYNLYHRDLLQQQDPDLLNSLRGPLKRISYKGRFVILFYSRQDVQPIDGQISS